MEKAFFQKKTFNFFMSDFFDINFISSSNLLKNLVAWYRVDCRIISSVYFLLLFLLMILTFVRRFGLVQIFGKKHDKYVDKMLGTYCHYT